MKSQSFLPYDSSTLANYKAWAQGIGTALSGMGWTKTTDTNQVVWANVLAAPAIAPIITTWVPPVAWAAGVTGYVGVNGGSAGAPSIVTDGGLVWACILSTTALVLTQALQNATVTLGTVTAVTPAGTGIATYTVASGVLGSQVGQQFVVTGMANPLNNGTFICTATGGTTSITLSNGNSVSASTQTGSMSSSATVLSFLGTITGATGNAFVGHSLTTAGFVNGANNITATVTSSHTNAFAVTATGVTETHAGTAVENTTPANDSVHWVGYNYELWQMTDLASVNSPIILRLVYTSSTGSPRGAVLYLAVGTSTTGNGYISGLTFTNGGNELTLPTATNLNGTGATTYECDFCVSISGGSLSMLLWRDAVFVTPSICSVLVLDRAKDSFGSDLDIFTVCLSASGTTAREQMIFKAASGVTRWPNTNTPFASWSIPNFNIANGTLAANNNAPALPIFPVGAGYLASPCLGAFVMKPLDGVEGSLVPVLIYGATHNFLMSKGSYTTVDAGSSSTAVFIGVRWE